MIKSLHATRQGNQCIDDASPTYRDLIYPAYFQSYLQEPHSIVTAIIHEGLDSRGLDKDQFKYVLSEYFFDKILGCFRVNNLRLEVVL